ncbi:hypothetical protein [Streptomyces xanthii]|uniref:hypothetical protein n=1 Tax=Streptomyces xanthii TaxID=2768069 RepID=UPI001CB788FA|nr:hypothetical protein [Streptomyces xanthii]
MPPAPPPAQDQVTTPPGHRRQHTRLRLSGLACAVVLAAALPLAGAFAGPVDDGAGGRHADAAPGDTAPGHPAREDTTHGDPTRKDLTGEAPAPARGSLLGAPDRSTASRCGPQLVSPEGVEAQTCVLTQSDDTWARTYYRNATGAALSAVLTLMAPDGRTVQITCAVGGGDEPGLCETPRGRTRGAAAEYQAVAEYASDAESPLLLRAGSNSAP